MLWRLIALSFLFVFLLPSPAAGEDPCDLNATHTLQQILEDVDGQALMAQVARLREHLATLEPLIGDILDRVESFDNGPFDKGYVLASSARPDELASALKAAPLWLRASFSSGVISAKVFPTSGSKTKGS